MIHYPMRPKPYPPFDVAGVRIGKALAWVSLTSTRRIRADRAPAADRQRAQPLAARLREGTSGGRARGLSGMQRAVWAAVRWPRWLAHRHLPRRSERSVLQKPEADMSETIISARQPREGGQWECQCARCGSSTTHVQCDDCGGDGYNEVYDEDPINNDEDETRNCSTCGGFGGWQWCLSSEEWCREHPLPGRFETERGQIEWWRK